MDHDQHATHAEAFELRRSDISRAIRRLMSGAELPFPDDVPEGAFNINVLSDRYSVAGFPGPCTHCGRHGKWFLLVLQPGGWVTISSTYDDAPYWYRELAALEVCAFAQVPTHVAASLAAVAPGLFQGPDGVFTNHCEHCGVAHAATYGFELPGYRDARTRNITLHEFRKPFACHGGINWISSDLPIIRKLSPADKRDALEAAEYL